MTTTPIGHRPASRRDDPSAVTAPDVEGRVQARRLQIASLRRLIVQGDVAITLCVVGICLGLGHVVAAGMSLAVSMAVTAQVFAADSPRSIVALRPVVKPAVTLSGIASVLVVVVAPGSAGREVLLGAACLSLALVILRAVVRLPRFATRLGLGRRRRLIVGDPSALQSAAARRAPGVDAGQVIHVVTRADRSEPGAPSSEQDPGAEPVSQDQRTQRDERSGPSGVVERVVRTALDNAAERVTVIPGDSWQQRQLRELSWLLEGTGIDIVISTNLDGIAPHRVDVVQQDGRLMIKVGSASPRGTQVLIKSVVDRLAAAVLLMLSSPVLMAIAAAVRLESRGAAIFTQARVREGGATFTMYKFRTMRVGAEQQLGDMQDLNVHDASQPLFKIENDPRVTRVGHVLRRTSLDELPQLLNVLKGQMSLIGPRPALPHEVELYDYAARRRLAVKPGMTGLWQVSGRSRLSWDESIGFDLDYVDNWSPGTDASIAVRTFRAVFTKDGAF